MTPLTQILCEGLEAGRGFHPRPAVIPVPAYAGTGSNGNLEGEHAVCLVSVDGDTTGFPIKLGMTKHFVLCLKRSG